MILPETPGGWKMVLADPPWNLVMRSANGINGRHASAHYPVMSLAEIRALAVPDIVAKDCHLMLWTTWPHLEQALAVMKVWGFKYSSNLLLWAKLNPTMGDALFMLPGDFPNGPGYTSLKNTEPLLLGRRGSPKRLGPIKELMISPRREHSRKPDETYRRIEAYCPGPRLEMFGRQSRPGWTVVGNEAAKFDDGSGAPSRHSPAPPGSAAETITPPSPRDIGSIAPPEPEAAPQSLDEPAVRGD